MFNVGSLFAGVGGICLGFKRASNEYKLVVANEIDKDACKTYKYNFNHKLIEGDIEKILNLNIFEEEINRLRNKIEELQLEVIEDDYIINYSNELIKEGISKCKKNYTEKLTKGISFEITNSLKKNLRKYYNKKINEINLEYNNYESIFSKFIEVSIARLEFQERNEKMLLNIETYSNKKNDLFSQRIDILTAGFPCQAFSIAGERRGFEDHRGELFFSVIETIKELERIGHGKPRVIFLENVKNLVSHDNGNTFNVIKTAFEDLGYNLKYKVLNTSKYTNLPQNRERIIIIGFLNKEDYDKFNFENIKALKHSKEELIENIKKYIDNVIEDRYFYYTKEKYPTYFMERKENEKRVINLDEQINKQYTFYQVRRGMYVRENKNGVCPTLTANMGTGGHNVPIIRVDDGIRKITPKECFNLQGFRVDTEYFLPKDVSKTNLYKQAGNAVSVDLIEVIAKELLNSLN